MRRRLSSDDKTVIVARYVDGESCDVLSEEFGVAHGTVHNVVRNAGVNRQIRTDNFDQSFFSSISDERKAYWLGFIYADGNVWKNTLCVALSEKDKTHIEKLRADLRSTAVLRYRDSNQSWSAKFNSSRMVGDLRRWGIVPAKSSIINAPILPDVLTKHFYRGYFDGDGWISKRNGQWSIGAVSGSKVFMDKLRDVVAPFAESKASVIELRGRNAYQIVFEGNGVARRAADWLYSDSQISLDRKYKLAMEVVK